MDGSFGRRGFLRGAAALGAVTAGAGCRVPWADWGSWTPPELRLPDGWDHPILPESRPPFCHGVASGDPTANRVIIWTRLTFPGTRALPAAVRWRVARDPEMRHVVARGTVHTGANRDWTVKVDVGGLEPGRTYHYDFASFGRYSPVGRTRTAPRLTDGIGVALVSCSSYWSGHWNAYARIAERDDVDLVVHAGDHIYDYPDDGEWVRARHDRLDENDVDFRTWRTLDEVRRRYALHASDPDLAALHHAHPMTIAWDNHDIATGATGDPRVPRRAFWEWTPCRPPQAVVGRDGNVSPADVTRDHRRIRYGDVDLFVLDVRTRSDDTTILGTEQRDWFCAGLLDSVAVGSPWRLVVNPIPIAPLSLGGQGYGGWTDRPGDVASTLGFLAEHGIDDCLFLAGDAHGAFVADLPLDQTAAGYDPTTGAGSVAVEILGNSVTRGGADEGVAEFLYSNQFGGPPRADRARFEPLLAQAGPATEGIERGLLADNPSLRFANWRDHGYGLVHLTPEAAVLEQWLVPHLTPSPDQVLGSRHTVVRGTNHAAPTT